MTAPPAAGPTAQDAPALLKQRVRKGEVMVDAEYSPHRDGPYHFDGTYLVRFAQYDPEAVWLTDLKPAFGADRFPFQGVVVGGDTAPHDVVAAGPAM